MLSSSSAAGAANDVDGDPEPEPSAASRPPVPVARHPRRWDAALRILDDGLHPAAAAAASPGIPDDVEEERPFLHPGDALRNSGASSGLLFSTGLSQQAEEQREPGKRIRTAWRTFLPQPGQAGSTTPAASILLTGAGGGFSNTPMGKKMAFSGVPVAPSSPFALNAMSATHGEPGRTPKDRFWRYLFLANLALLLVTGLIATTVVHASGKEAEQGRSPLGTLYGTLAHFHGTLVLAVVLASGSGFLWLLGMRSQWGARTLVWATVASVPLATFVSSTAAFVDALLAPDPRYVV